MNEWNKFFDNNSTTRPFEEAVEEMQKFSFVANPSSTRHPMGKKAREIVENSRKSLQSMVSDTESQIIFTSGATEANHLAIRGIIYNYIEKGGKSPVHVVTSSVEHPSVENLLDHLERIGVVNVTKIEIQQDTTVDVTKLLKAIRTETVLVTLIHAHGDTGAVNDLTKIFKKVKEMNPSTLCHSDCTQSFGKRIVNFNTIPEMDCFSVSAHKLYGPKGIGMLVAKNGVKLSPDFLGGHQENGLRAGTENVAAIVGMTKAFQLFFANREKYLKEILEKRQMIEKKLNACRILSPAKEINRLETTTMLALSNEENFCNTKLVELLGERFGFCISIGSACSTNSPHAPPVVRALKLPPGQRSSTVRISVGIHNSEKDCEDLVEAMKSLIESGECVKAEFKQFSLQSLVQKMLQNKRKLSRYKTFF